MHTNPEVLALVALGERAAASPQDLEHIDHCESCRREVTELGHLSEVGRSISDHFTLEAPSPDVWVRIKDQLGLGREFSSQLLPGPVPVPDPHPTPVVPPAAPVPVPDQPGSPVHPASRRRRILTLALAAVLALLAGVGGTLAWQQLRPPSETVIATAPLQAFPDWSGATGQATLEQGSAGQQVLVVSMITPRPVDGMQAVWLIDRDQSTMTQLGFLTAPVERFTLPPSFDIERFPVVDISVEQPDGDLAHSGHSIVRGTLDI